MAITTVVATRFADAPDHWPDDVLAVMRSEEQNGHVGQTLLSENERVRIWSISLKPGERLPFHRHVLDYFWTSLEAGQARSRYGDGKVLLLDYVVGETAYLRYAAGESTFHDLTNVGTTRLAFITVEFLDSVNRPLPL